MKNIAFTLIATFIAIPVTMAGTANNPHVPPSNQNHAVAVNHDLITPIAYLDPSEKVGGDVTPNSDTLRAGQRFS